MLTKSITKKSVEQSQDKYFVISFSFALTDDSGPGFTKDFTVGYRPGDSISGKAQEVISQMQTAVDKYKAERAIYNNAQMDNVVNTINSGVTL